MILRSLEGEEELGGCSPAQPTRGSERKRGQGCFSPGLSGWGCKMSGCVCEGGGVLCVVGGRVTGWAGSPGFDSARQS